ncbi:MAG: AmmeMemoRadiSam system protein A [Halanaerobiaceae bacterium]
MSKKDNIYVDLARKAIEEYANKGRRYEPEEPLPPELNKKAGAFVSIKKKGNLRGCIGTIKATRENLAREIIANAISAANRDPRFPAVSPEEIPELDISVDILGRPEKIDSVNELDPEKYGVIVEKGPRRGLLLPGLEGIDTVDKQLDIAYKKAGISPGENVQLYRFKVKRYK